MRIPLLRPCAHAHVIDALCCAGRRFAVDVIKACDWYRRAAELDHAGAPTKSACARARSVPSSCLQGHQSNGLCVRESVRRATCAPTHSIATCAGAAVNLGVCLMRADSDANKDRAAALFLRAGTASPHRLTQSRHCAYGWPLLVQLGAATRARSCASASPWRRAPHRLPEMPRLWPSGMRRFGKANPQGAAPRDVAVRPAVGARGAGVWCACVPSSASNRSSECRAARTAGTHARPSRGRLLRQCSSRTHTCARGVRRRACSGTRQAHHRSVIRCGQYARTYARTHSYNAPTPSLYLTHRYEWAAAHGDADGAFFFAHALDFADARDRVRAHAWYSKVRLQCGSASCVRAATTTCGVHACVQAAEQGSEEARLALQLGDAGAITS
jgi:hypothetical protein